MRVALVSANLFDIGGVESHIRFIGAELLRRGYELQLFKPTWTEDLDEARARDLGMPATIVDLGPKPYEQAYLRPLSRFAYLHGFLKRASFSLAAARVRDAVTVWRPDLVWQHDFSSSWLGCRLLSRLYPVVLTNHTGEYLLLRRLPGATHLLRRLMSHYRAVIGPSQELTPDFRDRSVTIHNGVDLAYFTPLPAASLIENRQRLLGDRSDRFVVFCPRRWAPTKGVIYLAEALTKLVRDGERSIYVVFAGSDYDLYRDYATRIRERLDGVETSFLEVGNLDFEAMRDWYRISDLVVIPSLMEAVSLAALEAMACGTPVLSTNVGGMPEIIESDVTGLLVPPADSHALASAIVRAHRDPELMERIRTKALEMVRNRYGWDVIAAQTATVLERAVTGDA